MKVHFATDSAFNLLRCDKALVNFHGKLFLEKSTKKGCNDSIKFTIINKMPQSKVKTDDKEMFVSK